MSVAELYNNHGVILMSEKVNKIMKLVEELSIKEFEELVAMIDDKAEVLGILKIAGSWWDNEEDAVYDYIKI